LKVDITNTGIGNGITLSVVQIM